MFNMYYERILEMNEQTITIKPQLHRFSLLTFSLTEALQKIC